MGQEKPWQDALIFISLSINSKNIIPDVFATDVSVFKDEELVSESFIKKNEDIVFTTTKPYFNIFR